MRACLSARLCACDVACFVPRRAAAPADPHCRRHRQGVSKGVRGRVREGTFDVETSRSSIHPPRLFIQPHRPIVHPSVHPPTNQPTNQQSTNLCFAQPAIHGNKDSLGIRRAFRFSTLQLRQNLQPTDSAPSTQYRHCNRNTERQRERRERELSLIHI